MGAVATAIACAIAKLIIKNGKSRIEDHQQFSILHSTYKHALDWAKLPCVRTVLDSMER